MKASGRSGVSKALRVVVKVGSSSISGVNADQIDPLVAALAESHEHGTEIILVSSGAIATGMPYLSLSARPQDLATQQAAAAVGQNVLVYRYQASMDQFGMVAGQVLLTAGDLDEAVARSNARRALTRLLGLGILPIVNENDTVATHEIRFGDNDRLAALVATLLEADALVLLSDVDAIYTMPPDRPGAQRIELIRPGDAMENVEFGEARLGGVGTGGAATKVSAATLAASNGTGVLVTSTHNVAAALRGEDVGTWFEPAPPLEEASVDSGHD